MERLWTFVICPTLTARGFRCLFQAEETAQDSRSWALGISQEDIAVMLRFAVVGIDHGHTFDHVKGLLAAGAEFVGYCPQTSVPALLETFKRTYPDAPQIARDAIFADPSIDVICIAAIPRDRA